MPVLELQRRMMELGRIRLGEKGSKGEPKRLTAFRLTSASRALLEGAAQEYGGTVQEWAGAPDEGYFELYTETDTLDVILPPVFSKQDGTPTLPYSQWYELWSGGGCQRRCDGETEMLSGKACQCDAENRACQITTRLNVMLPKVPGLGVWRLESKGWNAATILPSTLDVLMLAAAEQRFIPAVLRIEQRTKKITGERYPRRFVVPVIDLPQLKIGDMLAGQPQFAFNAPAVAQEKPALPAPESPPIEVEAFEHDSSSDVPFGEEPELPDSTAGRAALSDGITEALTLRLLELCDEFGADPKTTRDAIAKNQNKHLNDEKQHRLWLERQIEVVEDNLAKRKAEDESQFATMAKEAQAKKAKAK